MSGWLNKPLTMNVWANAAIYGAIVFLINTCLDILIGVGFFTMMSVAVMVTVLSNMENNWVREIERRQVK